MSQRLIATTSGGTRYGGALDVRGAVGRGQFCFRGNLMQIVRCQKATRASVQNRGLPRMITAGMHKAQSARIKQQWQCQGPVEHLLRVRLPYREFIQKRLVLGHVRGRMRPHVAINYSTRVQTRQMAEQRVQVVIAHDRDSVSLIMHGANEREDRLVRVADTDEIAGKCRDASLRMRPSRAAHYIAERRQRLRQAVDVRVNVGDVVLRCHHAT